MSDLIPDERLQRLRRALATSLADGASVGISAVGTGMFTADGRQVGAVVSGTNTDMLRVSDGGETWSELWIDGYVKAKPTQALRLKLEDLCRQYGVNWDQEARAIVALAREDDFVDVTKRIAAASIAIDGWRLWLGERDFASERVERLVREACALAEKREWQAQRGAVVQTKHHEEWRTHALLRRQGRQAVLAFVDERMRDRAMQRAMGWIHETDYALIFVMPADVANDIHDSDLFHGRARVLPRLARGTPEAIVLAAESIAAS